MEKIKIKKKRELTKSDKLKILRLIILAIVIIVIIIFSIKLFDVVNSLSDEAYSLEFKQKVSDMGFFRSYISNRASGYSDICSSHSRAAC